MKKNYRVLLQSIQFQFYQIQLTLQWLHFQSMTQHIMTRQKMSQNIMNHPFMNHQFMSQRYNHPFQTIPNRLFFYKKTYFFIYFLKLFFTKKLLFRSLVLIPKTTKKWIWFKIFDILDWESPRSDLPQEVLLGRKKSHQKDDKFWDIKFIFSDHSQFYKILPHNFILK